MFKLGIVCLIYLFVDFILIANTYGQDKYLINGAVFIRDAKANKTNLTVSSSVYEDLKIPIDAQGNFQVLLPWDADYLLKFSRVGYVSKWIEISTLVPFQVVKNSIQPYHLQVELFPIRNDVDSMFYKNPVALIKYDEKINDFDFDLDYQMQIVKSAKPLKKEAVQKRSNEELSLDYKETNIKDKEEIRLYEEQQAVASKDNIVVVPLVNNERNNHNSLSKNLPTLKNSYSDGKYTDIHTQNNKTVTRVIVANEGVIRVFYKVEHNWGGVFYFKQEASGNFLNISKYSFEKSIGN